MSAIDWEAARTKLVEESCQAVRDFADEHKDEECCYFAFDSDPKYGYVLLCLDTSSNSRKSAQSREKSAIERREKMLTREGSWKNASYHLTKPMVMPFGDDTGDFAYIAYRELAFPDWQEFAHSKNYPPEEANTDDYLDSHFRILIWKVIEDLVERKAFECLRKSSPFMIGYGIHDQEMSIVRMLWNDNHISP